MRKSQVKKTKKWREIKKSTVYQLREFSTVLLKYEEEVSALTDEEIRILNMLLDDKKILRMSYGELVNKKIHVTQGPLKNMDEYIVKYDKHNRLATLNLNFLNQIWKVGVTIPE